MNSDNYIRVSVFGNEWEKSDNLANRLIPRLKEKYPLVEFILQDPTESLKPLGQPWIVIDVAQGIDKVTVVSNLDALELVKSLSVHDYDVYLDFMVKKKLGKLGEIIFILIPQLLDPNQAFHQVCKKLDASLKLRL